MPEARPGWTFLDFVDQHGENLFRRWLHEQPVEVRAYFNVLIMNLAVLDRVFTRPDSVGLLVKPPCVGEKMIDLIGRIKRVQYRPIGCYGPSNREITLLVGATERGGAFSPRNAEHTAISRKRLVMANRRHVVEHDYS